MNNIQEYIPIALEVLAEQDLGIVRKGKINKTYNGYISSFGASIITSGLLPTMVFYSKSTGGEEDANRSLILKAIEKMLKHQNIAIFNTNQQLLKEIITRYNDRRLKKKIEECAIALKLGMRTYPMTKN
ncbi:MAG: type III-B CRISPR module-associated protein Cmr5 [Bacteroidales bacterium]|jgi:CRISPR-associated protein Cmr5|nr:type III-B CRISPR module-associated protein Cmr5 [Bacteroidales bacterium]